MTSVSPPLRELFLLVVKGLIHNFSKGASTMSAKLPCKECGGRCCEMAAFTMSEFKKIRDRIPTGAVVVNIEFVQGSVPGVPPGNPGKVIINPMGRQGSRTCAFLTEEGCSIFDDRPRACRLYGESDDDPCEFLHPGKSRLMNLIGPAHLAARNRRPPR